MSAELRVGRAFDRKQLPSCLNAAKQSRKLLLHEAVDVRYKCGFILGTSNSATYIWAVGSDSGLSCLVLSCPVQ